MNGLFVVSLLLIFLGFIIIFFTLVKVSPFEKGVKERLSKYHSTLQAGWHIIIPFIESVKKVDMRERVINTPAQNMITSDNAAVLVDSVIFTQIYDAKSSTYEIQDPILAVSSLGVTTLRGIIGTMTLDDILGDRQKINTYVQTNLAKETDKWGIRINKVEIQKIDPPKDLVDAMSKQKIAEQEKRAYVLTAEGKKQSYIIEAQGYKEKQILEAQGQAEAIERIAQARAKEIEYEASAAIAYFKDNAILKEQLRVAQNSLKDNSKFVIDSDIVNTIKGALSKIKI
ncbi:SPFH domain-containing protein [Candidatus Vampirococcus lugosii]|uniref:Peptidase n=1 Tax=Candidatus Vampirococcus lugosii TaxID=2789015 RepID=A0ABS5QLU2_9BACT|nr:SPFH domain-containing protein [Candidatus Vampirococcus lugosii]MBS8122160.1 peptidase [Candidatus Vampirococcus lugosii]